MNFKRISQWDLFPSSATRKKKKNLNKWILQQVVDNDWKAVPSEMIKLIHFHFDVSTFAMVQSPGLKIKKT